MTIAGTMTKFKLDHVALVDRPAQEHALAVIAKRQVQGDSDGDTDVDAMVKAMIARGAARAKSPEDDEDPAPELGPGEIINWKKTAAAHSLAFVAMAKARAKADACSYERAYVKVMNDHPRAAKRMMMG